MRGGKRMVHITADSRLSWLRLALATLAATVGGVGMWSVVVALPAVEAEFGISRAAASLPYTLTMVGFALGGVAFGRAVDRFGLARPLAVAGTALGLGYAGAAAAQSLWQFALAQGLLIGAASSIGFGPLMAEVSHWFHRHRATAIAVCAAGNYLAGAFWPPVMQQMMAAQGWRAAHLAIGLTCILVLVPLAWTLRRPAVRPAAGTAPPPAAMPVARSAGGTLPLSPAALQLSLWVAGIACCVAMATPQVHIVAYCGDLGYGVARGTQMLALMLACGIVSRVASGWVADRIGGLRTLLLGSVLQGVALVLYALFDGLLSLYVISALFGLFQGGLVPSYAIVVREHFPAAEAGERVGKTLMATLLGMALGGWLAGRIFDWSGGYHAAFVHGLAWNLLNITVIGWLLWLATRHNATGGRLARAAG